MKWIAPHGATSSTERYVNAQPTIAGSNPDAAFFNTVLDELLAVITTANMTPTDANLHQISDAIVYLTDRAATSGVTKGSYWFGKTTAGSSVPAPTAVGQTYIDFTNLKTYISNNGTSWTQSGTFVPPTDIDFTILITSKFWDITEQSGQQGGEAKYAHTTSSWTYWPKIISFNDAALTGTPTTPIPAASDSTNSTTIVPVGWVNDPAKSTNVVHRSGTETIAGTKTFSGTVKAPTISSASDNSTKVATTEFVTKVLGAVYPVGSIYIGTQSTCPMATLISGSTWEQIQGRYLLASGTLAGTSENYSATDTVAAGLPDHAHNVRYRRNDQSAYHANGNVSPHIYTGDNLKGSYPSLNASESNSVYGQSTTNRPAAYVVNVWRRTA